MYRSRLSTEDDILSKLSNLQCALGTYFTLLFVVISFAEMTDYYN